MPPAQRGTGFVNLTDWLGLNKGAAQGMADSLSGDVNHLGQAYNGAEQGAMGTFNNALAANRLQVPQGQLTAEQAAQVGAETYNGPAGLDGGTVAGLYGKAAAAQNAASVTDSNEGRQALLAKHYGSTTWGGGALDAALAGAGDARGGMSGARGAYSRLISNLQGVQDYAAQKATAAKDSFNKGAAKYGAMAPGLQQQEDAANLQKRQQQRQTTQYANQSNRVDSRYRNPPGYP
jgi:hypothetical protein